MAKRKKRNPNKKPFHLPPPEVKYPIATVAYYGPDDRVATKVAVGIVNQHQMIVALERWFGDDVATSVSVQSEIQAFINRHNVKQVVVTDGILGCPHEEGIDFSMGEDCPFCPFWAGKQGTAARDV